MSVVVDDSSFMNLPITGMVRVGDRTMPLAKYLMMPRLGLTVPRGKVLQIDATSARLVNKQHISPSS